MNFRKINFNSLSAYFHNKLLGVLGVYIYPSYWHYLVYGEKTDPITETFYYSARPNPGAGIGHQLANWIAGYHYAKAFGVRFAHLPFSKLEWENFLGFGVAETTVISLRKQGFKLRKLPLFDHKDINGFLFNQKIMSSYSGKKIIFLAEQDQFFREQQEECAALQQKFHSAPSRQNQKLLFDPQNLNIAIHVRRGDIMTDDNNPNLAIRYLSNDYFEKVLSQVIDRFSRNQSKPLHIWFFSQGKPEDYPEFAKFKNLHWCLDMNAQDSFLHMVYADVLITSKSSFSYKPALLNKNGIKICPQNFWHGYPESSEWVMVDNEGVIQWR